MLERTRRTLSRAVLALSALAVLGAAGLLLSSRAEMRGYRELAAEVREDAGGAGAGRDGGIDWASLIAVNPDTVAWLRVGGTSIDYPVVRPSASRGADRYLHRDFWGKRSGIGCPYLDRRCDPDGPHAIVYAHHLGETGKMFSDIHDSYRPDVFDGVGDAVWSTPGGGDAPYAPLMAMSVDKEYQPIQRTTFDGEGDMEGWLRGLAGDAQALSPDAEALIEGASRALTLVTCSSGRSGQRARTLLVFVR